MKETEDVPDLSIVVIVHAMNREAPRTLSSLTRSYQKNIEDINYEVLIVDNGSPEPFVLEEGSLEGKFRLHRILEATKSPANAANLGISMTHGKNICIILDGARMLTPGVVAAGVRALRLHHRAISTPMAWHLGYEHQSISITKGYDAKTEDALLEEIHWPEDGYRLFEIASLAGANPNGMMGDINESCCLFLPRSLWDEVGGYDEQFNLPGGGLVNLDLFTRLNALSDSQLVVLLGEGNFHQVHGGASTSPHAEHALWGAQYMKLRGRGYTRPDIDPIYMGKIPPASRRWLVKEEKKETALSVYTRVKSALGFR